MASFSRPVPDYIKQEQEKLRAFNTDLDFLEVDSSGAILKILPQPNEPSPFLSLYFWSVWSCNLYTQAYELNWGSDTYKDPVGAVVSLLQSYGFNVTKPRLYAYFNVYNVKANKVQVAKVSKTVYDKILKIQNKQIEKGLPLLEEDGGITLEVDLSKTPSGYDTWDITPGTPYTVPKEVYTGKTFQLRNKLRPRYKDESIQKLVQDAYKYALEVLNANQNSGVSNDVLREQIKTLLQSILQHNLLINSRNKLANNPFDGLMSLTQSTPTMIQSSDVDDVQVVTDDPFAFSQPDPQPVVQTQSIPTQTQSIPTQTQAIPTQTQIPPTSTPNITTQTRTPQPSPVQQPGTGFTTTTKVKIPGSPDCYGTKVPAAGLDCNKCAYMLLCHS